MDRNSIIGLILILAIFIGYNLFTAPSKEEVRKMRQEQMKEENEKQQEETRTESDAEPGESESTPSSEKATAEAEMDASESQFSTEVPDSLQKGSTEQNEELKKKYGIFANAAQGKEKTYTIENEEVRITLTNKGGRVASVELKNYKTYDSLPLHIWKKDSSRFNLTFKYDNRDFFATEDFYFTAMDSSFSVAKGERKNFRMRLKTGDPDKYLEYIYSLTGEGFILEQSVHVNELGDKIDRDLELNWAVTPPTKEKTAESERRTSTVCFKYQGDDDIDWLSETGEEEEQLSRDIEWVSYKQHFFSAILISEQGFDKYRGNVRITPSKSDKWLKRYETNMTIPLANTSAATFPMKFYFGPNHYQTLSSYDKRFEDTMNLGWGIFGWMNEYVIIPIFNYLNNFFVNYGIIILVLTFIIKLILFPLTYKSYLSTAKMKVIKPEIDELNEQHKDADPMKKQQAMMDLYKKSGVNPMAGCIPMLIQMPILIAMYRFFPASIELRQESFLWAEDLSTYDSILALPFNIPFYGDHVSLFTLLMFVSTILYTKINSGQMSGTNQMPQMKIMMYLFPIMILFIFNSFPAGLSYYYFAANVISMGQMLFIKKFIIDEDKMREKIQENRKKPKKNKKSKFQKRMEEMAKKRGIEPPKK